MKVKTFLLAALFLAIAPSTWALEVGQAAPLFVADSTHGRLALQDLVQQGPVVLAFYFADFTPV